MRHLLILLLVVLAGLLPASLAAQSPDAFVLIPVYSKTNGANGSRWETYLILRNDGSTPASFTPIQCYFPCLGYDRLPAMSTRHEDALRGAQNFDGRVVRIGTPAELDHVAFSLRVNDTSRNALSAGTEIPVVRPNEFRQRVILLNVPADDRFRHSLRVYDVSNGSRVRIRVYREDTDALLVDQEMDLLQPPEQVTTVAQFSIHGMTDAFPSLRDVGTFRVEIDALQPTQKLWAFVSVTNNATQEFTVVSPQ